MNKVILSGRLTADPEIRNTQSGKPVASYRLAVDRIFKQEGEENADFISCVAFGKSAEFVGKYFTKGVKIIVEGSIRTGSYTNKDGVKIYTTDVIVDRHEFCESKKSSGESGGYTTAPAPTAPPSYMPDAYTNTAPQFEELASDDELPF